MKVIVVTGPTATGKSDLAVELAKKLDGEVISADSRQVYKGLNIGTGKITKKEMQGVKHYLLDVADPRKRFSVIDYVSLAQTAIEEISKRGKLPIICGGTGFYIEALIDGVIFPDVPPNQNLRDQLRAKTPSELLAMLLKLDKERASKIDPLNSRRLIRAIEIAKALGKVPKIEKSEKKMFEPFFIGLTLPPDELKKKINIRLQMRLKAGMLDEAKRLHSKGLSWKRMEELGLEYRYMARYLQGKISKEQMERELASEIWKYAKRQMTWWRKESGDNY